MTMMLGPSKAVLAVEDEPAEAAAPVTAPTPGKTSRRNRLAADKSKPSASQRQAEPVDEAPEPVGEAPEPLGEAPEPADEAPELVDEVPEPLDEAPAAPAADESEQAATPATTESDE